MSEEQTTGTPEQDDGDAAEPTTGTPETDGRDAEPTAEPSDIEKLNLEWKQKAEQFNTVQAELNALKERLSQTSPADQDASASIQGRLDRIRQWADPNSQNDPVAQEVLELRGLIEQMAIGTGALSKAMNVEDRTLRQRALDRLASDPVRYGDFQTALDSVEAEDLREKTRTQDEEIKKLREALEKQKQNGSNNRDVVRTDVRDVSASQVKENEMTMAEFDQEQARIRQEQGDHAAMMFAGKLARGEIRLRR